MQHNDSLVSQDFIRRHIGIPLERLIPYALGASLLVASAVYADTEARPVLIVPKSAGDRNMQTDAQPESFESYQIRILRNQNHLQAEKIKTLREELAEITQKLHEMKPRLFTQSDPADQAKIATLAEKLREKEELTNQLTAAKNALERDFASVRKKLTEMETVKEALTAMIEKQRIAKDQSHSEFKKQIEELHTTTANEKSSLLKTIQQHEAAHQRLQETIASKTQDVSRLDNVATKLSATLASKHEELLALEARLLAAYQETLLLSELHATKEDATQANIQNLTYNLDQNRQENRQLRAFREEMKWIADLYHGSQQVLHKEIDKLSVRLQEEKERRDRLAQLKADLEAQYAEQAQQLNSSEKSRQEALGNIQTLSASLEAEHARTTELEQTLLVLLSHQEAGQIYSENLQKLIDVLTQDSAALAEHHTLQSGTLFHHLDSATVALESQEKANQLLKKREAVLRNTLQEAYVNQVNQQRAIEEREQQAGTLLHHLDNASLTIEAQEAEMHQLLSQFASEKEHWATHEATLKDALQEAFANYEKALEKGSELALVLHETEIKAQGIEEQLALRHYALMEQEGRALELEANHEAAVRTLESRLTDLNQALSAEAHRATHLEALLQQNATLAMDQSNTIEEHKQLIAERMAAVDDMQKNHTGAVAVLEKQVTGLRDNLETQTGLTRHLALEVNRKNEELNQRLLEREIELNEKQGALEVAQQNLDQLKAELSARLEDLAKALESERSQANALQAQVEQLTLEHDKAEQHKQELEALVRDLSRDLSEKQQLLALAEDKAATTDYDNQALAKQNRDLGLESHAARAAYVEALDLLHTHAASITEIQQQLKIAQDASKDAASAVEQLSNLRQRLEQREARIAFLEDAKANLERESVEQVRKLESERDALVNKLESERVEQVNKLELALNDEKNQRSLAERDLQYARMNYTAERRSLLNLEQIARESMNKTAALEQAYSEAVGQKGDLENNLGLLTLDKQGFEQDLVTLSQKLEEVLENEKNLKVQFQNEMAATKQQHDEQIKAMEAEIAAFDAEKAKHHEHHAELKDKIAFIEALNQNMQTLEEQLKLAQENLEVNMAVVASAEERIAKAKEHNHELLAENQRLFKEKSQLELLLIERMEKKLNETANTAETHEEEASDGLGRTRLRRVNELKSSFNNGSEE